MLELEEALSRVLTAVQPLGCQAAPVTAAEGRIVADQVLASVDLPPFDNSAMDGYAVCAADVARAGADHPVASRLIGRVAAGETFSGTIEPGTCVRLFTGSPLPAGADAVVMQEDARLDPAHADAIVIVDSVKPWENVRLQGEDVKRGSAITLAGDRLSLGQVGLLAATGIGELAVGRQPRVGLIATGSELVEPGQPLGPGKIYESNRITLASLAARAGGLPHILPLVGDSLAATRYALEAALDKCDAVVTTGGVSVGEFDLVKQAFEQLGGELAFWKVAIRPGKPFVFGRIRDKLFFGLPGNPVSAFVTFLLLVRPALLRMQGARDVGLPSSRGVLAEPIVNQGDRRHFIRVVLDAAGQVWSAGTQASHALSSLARTNGLVDVPARSSLAAASVITVLGWN